MSDLAQAMNEARRAEQAALALTKTANGQALADARRAYIAATRAADEAETEWVESEKAAAGGMIMPLTLKRAASRKTDGGGWVLFGSTPGITRRFRGHKTDWLEKWFLTPDAATSYAAKLGATVIREGGAA